MREVSRVTPRISANTDKFTENGMSERARFREEDPEFCLGPVELEALPNSPQGNTKQTVGCTCLE